MSVDPAEFRALAQRVADLENTRRMEDNIANAVAEAIRRGSEGEGGQRKTFKMSKEFMPQAWSGDRDKASFAEFSFQVKNFMLLAHDRGPEVIHEIEKMGEFNMKAIDDLNLDIDVHNRLNMDLYTMLARCTSGNPNVIIRNVQVGQGYEGWYRILQRYDPKNALDKNSAYALVATPRKER